MTKTITLQSNFGPIDVEVDDATALEMTGQSLTGVTAKGVTPMSKNGDQPTGKMEAKFDTAMTSLSNYAKSVQQMVDNLDVTPEKVTIDVGLKLAFKAGTGFLAIATAETTADMKVSLTWEPKKGRAE